MGKLQAKFEWKDDYLLVTGRGQVTVEETLAIYKKACDLAAERGVARILVNALAVEGGFSTLDRYVLGETMARYCLERGINPKVATVGKPPTIDGFATRVAANRGVITTTFSEMQPALDWLATFDTRSHVSSQNERPPLT